MNELVETNALQQLVAKADADKKAFAELANAYAKVMDRTTALDALQAMRSCGSSAGVGEAQMKFNRKTDQMNWLSVLTKGDFGKMLNTAQRSKMYDDIYGEKADIPEFTYENVQATLGDKCADAYKIFAEGLRDVLGRLDRKYVTNQTMSIEQKFIVKGFRGGMHRWSEAIVNDLMRAIRIVHKLPDTYGDDLMNKVSWWTQDSRQETENDYLHILVMKNGNAHITIKQVETIELLNAVLASLDGGRSVGVARPDRRRKPTTDYARPA